MFPWIWVFAPQFAPQLHYPWSGAVAQNIEPDLSWFFDAIRGRAGSGRIEEKAFKVASYGKQLGLITEVLLDATEKNPPADAGPNSPRARLKHIHDEIELIKDRDAEAFAQDIAAALRRLERTNASEHARVMKRLRALVAAPEIAGHAVGGDAERAR